MVAHANVPTGNQASINSPQDLLDAEMEAHARRYSRNPHPELTFEFTRDPGLLHQYYKIRENEFNNVLGLIDYSGAENEYDRSGHIMVVRRGSFCVGGARINVKTPRMPHLLPVEMNGFRLENYFSRLKYKQLSYGQACTFSLLPEFRGGDISREMVKHVCYKAAALNLSVLFGACPILNARLYKQACVSIGLTGTAMHPDIALPVHKHMEHIHLYLISIPLDKLLPKDTPAITQDKEHLSKEVACCM